MVWTPFFVSIGYMRRARVIIPGGFYHVTHRGNHREQVFFDDADREYYCYWLRCYAGLHEADILAYCLMTNHVHLVLGAGTSSSVSRTVGRTHGRYAEWVNKRRSWSGHLWANRFYSSLLDERHLRCAVRYVELNPVRAGMVTHADAYCWSSAATHTRGRRGPIPLRGNPFPEIQDWSRWLESGSGVEDELIRRNTLRGRPSGDTSFIESVERQLDCSLAEPRRGRPVKTGTVPNFGK